MIRTMEITGVIKNIEDWHPLGDKVIVEPFTPPEKSSGGVYFAEEWQLRVCQGKVIKVGKGRWNKQRTVFIPCQVKEGDYVLYSRYGGFFIKEQTSGRNYIILREETDILAITGEEVILDTPSY